MSFRWNPLSRRGTGVRWGVESVPGRAKPRRRRASLECLEDRTLLSNSVPVSSAQWSPFGPAPIVGGTTAPGGLPVTGRITGIAASPTVANTIFVASSGGGVWRTTDGGTTWSPLTDGQATLFTGSVAIAPSDPSVIYAGTGEANNSTNSFYGEGVLKSTDGGATWTLEDNNGAFDRRTIGKIVVDPGDPNTVFAMVSNPGTNGLAANTGIWKSTDGGATWVDTTAGISTTATFSDLVMDPNTPTTLFTAVGSDMGNAANGVYKSTDDGTTWTLVGTTLPSGVADGRITLATGSGVIYASIVGSGGSGSTAFGSLFKFERSLDGGATWTDLTATTPDYFGGSQGWFDTTLAVNPANPLNVFAGGSSAGGAKGIIESQDGGTTWADISVDGSGNGPAPVQTAIGFDANGDLLAGSAGGIFKFGLASQSWSDLNGNLQITSFNGVALDPTDANTAYGATQQNGTVKFTDSTQWNQLQAGDAGDVQVEPSNPTTVYHTVPFAVGPGFFQVSTDGGSTWTPATNGINVLTDTAGMYTPFTVDPSTPGRILLGTDRVYETTDNGATWNPISTPTMNGWNSQATVAITSIAVAASDANTIYATTADGKLYVTNNDGTSWTERDVPGATDSPIGVRVDPNDPQIAFVVRNAFNAGPLSGHVFETINGGRNWSNISGNLPNLPAWSFAIDASTPNAPVFFVGTDSGVYTSTDGGTTWSPFRTGLPNAQVRSLELVPSLNLLAAGTYGRGLFEIIEINPLQVTAVPVAGGVEGKALNNVVVATFTDGPNPDPIGNFSATINWGDGTPASAGTIVQTPTGFEVEGSHTFADEGTATITVTVSDTNGDTGSASSTTTVSDAPLTPVNNFTINGVEGQTVGGVIGKFFDGNFKAPATDFTAMITWGDNVTTKGTVVVDSSGPGEFDVQGSHTYAVTGQYPVSIAVADVGGSSTAITGTASIADAPLHSAGLNVQSTEGGSFTSQIATFTDDDPNGAAGDYTAMINWGDGTPANPDITAGTVSALQNGGFGVQGTHTYTQVGQYTIATTITDVTSTTTATSIATVLDAQLTANGGALSGTEGLPLVAPGQPLAVVGTFTDADPNAVINNYAPVTIGWGDGTSSPGTLSPLGGGKFNILGSHTYSGAGTYTITVPVVDDSNGRTPTDATDAKVTVSSTATIVDAPLTAAGTTVTATEGQSITPAGQPSTTVATFTDANPVGKLSDFTATIDWGDGTPANPDVTTAVIAQPGGVGTTFDISGTKTYASAGTYTITVTISDAGGSTATAVSTATIADAPLSGNLAAIPTLTQGATFAGVVATFTDADPDSLPSDFIAPITWGDGNSSLGALTALGNGVYTITSSNTYTTPGQYTVTVKVVDLGGSTLKLTGTATVQDAPIIASPGGTIISTAGSAFNGLVATFTQSTFTPVNQFSATINWGDGTTTPGTIGALPNGKLGVTGSHVYTAENTYAITVTISDAAGTTATTTATASVLDAPISANPANITAVEGQVFNGVVATFSDGNPFAKAGDFSAVVQYGDGQQSAGQIVALGGSQFQVVGTNTYAASGNLPLTVTIQDKGGASATVNGTANVLATVTATVNVPLVGNFNQPGFSGTAAPNSTIQLFAQPLTGGGGQILIGTTTTDASGHWSIPGIPLPDGIYAVIAKMLDASGNVLETAQILPTATQGPLIIDTTGPTVVSTALNPAAHQLVVTLQDATSGLSPASLINTANFSLMTVGRTATPLPLALTGLAFGTPGTGQIVETFTYVPTGRTVAGTYVLTINAPGIKDNAGNTLVEKTFVTFPQTTNFPNPNYVAQFTVSASGVASGPQPYISSAERAAASQFVRFGLSHTKGVIPPRVIRFTPIRARHHRGR